MWAITLINLCQYRLNKKFEVSGLKFRVEQTMGEQFNEIQPLSRQVLLLIAAQRSREPGLRDTPTGRMETNLFDLVNGTFSWLTHKAKKQSLPGTNNCVKRSPAL